jgi:hypothetical protein
LRQAQTDGRLHIVVLDGINRAPVEAWLSPLLEIYNDAGRGSQPRQLLLRGELGYEWFAWPRNVLLAATAVPGAATIAPPAAFWGSACLIDTELVDEDENSSNTKNEPGGPFDMEPKAWSALEAARPSEDAEFSTLLADLEKAGLAVSTAANTACMAMAAWLSVWTPAATTRHTEVLLACLAPMLDRDELDSVKAVLSGAHLDVPMIERAIVRKEDVLGR